MKIIVKTPTKAYLKDYSSAELAELRSYFKYIRSDITFQIKKLKDMRWFRQNNPEAFEIRLSELESQRIGYLMFKEGDEFYIRTGSIPYLPKKCEIVSEITYPEPKLLGWKKPPEFEPYPYQSDSVEELLKIKHGNISLPTGCHAKGTKILMYDGTVKNVEDIHHNDILMGPDSLPRIVQYLVSGKEQMYKIIPNIGEPFIVNENHILSLRCTGLRKKPKFCCHDKKDQIMNISVKEYLKKSKYFKHIWKLYRANTIVFNTNDNLLIDPYIFGLWLGDGHKHEFTITTIDSEIVNAINKWSILNNYHIIKRGDVSYNISDLQKGESIPSRRNVLNTKLKQLNVFRDKHIPQQYLTSSIENRSKLLAGLLDSDGYNHKSCFEIIQKQERLANDIVFLCRSLGFGVSVKQEFKYASNTEKKIKRLYFRISIRGDFTNIPTKIPRKQISQYNLNRNPLNTGFHIEPIGIGDYYGFGVDRDNLYVMGDFTVTHNCGKSLCLVLLTKKLGLKTVVVTPSKSIFNELLDEFTERFGKSKVGGYGDGKKDLKKQITIAIGKSLTMIKEGSEAEKFFKNKEVMLIDESHTFGADQLEKVSQAVLSDIPYRFFVSATQTRNNGTEKVLESIIGKTVFDMTLEDAINGKYLCPLKFSILEVFSPSTSMTKDPLKAKRHHLLYNPQIAEKISKIIHKVTKENKSVLVLVDELRQISLLGDILKVPYTYIHSGSKKDANKWKLDTVKLKDELLKFNKGEVRVLIGTKAIATGTNIYPTHVTVNWSGGSSIITVKQGAMGRSTRKLEISKFKDCHAPKPFSHIVDFYIKNQPTLNNQLRKRIEYYRESGGEIKHVKT